MISAIELAEEKGIEKGIEKGERKAELRIAKQLLADGIDPKSIAKATGFTLDELRSLQQK